MIIRLECDEREAQALGVLIDAAVKALGIRGAGDAVLWIQKLEVAMCQSQNGNGQMPTFGDNNALPTRS